MKTKPGCGRGKGSTETSTKNVCATRHRGNLGRTSRLGGFTSPPGWVVVKNRGQMVVRERKRGDGYIRKIRVAAFLLESPEKREEKRGVLQEGEREVEVSRENKGKTGSVSHWNFGETIPRSKDLRVGENRGGEQ